jgi:hypothetical protein
MKSIRVVLFLVATVVAFAMVLLKATPQAVMAAWVCWFVIGALLSVPQTGARRAYATLSATEILSDTLEAFKVQFPILTGPAGFGTDFSTKTAKLNDQIIAHIRSLPSVQGYDATTGYEANAAEASSLLVDVPVTLDQHKHVPVKIDHLDVLSSKKDLYQGAINDMAFVLGKSVVDFALGKVVTANFSYGANVTNANASKDTLDAATKKLNQLGNAPMGRFGIVNSDLYNALEADARIASGDYHGQMRGDNAYGELRNVSGFSRIFEYPDLTTAAGEQLNGFFGTRTAVALASRVPSDPSALAASIGIPAIAKFETVSDPGSGLTLFGIQWMKSGTFDIYLTVAILYGGAAGKRGGANGVICDKAGYRVTEAGGVFA